MSVKINNPSDDRTSRAFKFTLSLNKNVSGTQYECLKEWIQKEFFYYAIKVEDVNGEGKIHVHGIGFKDFATKDTPEKDYRYLAVRTDNAVDRFVTFSSNTIQWQKNSHGFKMYNLHSDEGEAYLEKETLLNFHRLPADRVLLRQYYKEITAPKPKNPEYTAHIAKYEEMGYPLPATWQTVQDYYNERCFVLNDLQVITDDTRRKALKLQILLRLNGEGYSDPDPTFKKRKITPKDERHLEFLLKKMDFLDRENEINYPGSMYKKYPEYAKLHIKLYGK